MAINRDYIFFKRLSSPVNMTIADNNNFQLSLIKSARENIVLELAIATL